MVVQEGSDSAEKLSYLWIYPCLRVLMTSFLRELFSRNHTHKLISHIGRVLCGN